MEWATYLKTLHFSARYFVPEKPTKQLTGATKPESVQHEERLKPALGIQAGSKKRQTKPGRKGPNDRGPS
jgi:hypothetical protein